MASAIRIGNPASWEFASAALQESQGAIDIVTDLEILEAQRFLAAHEGIFVEPASAASVAGLLKCLEASARRGAPADRSAGGHAHRLHRDGPWP